MKLDWSLLLFRCGFATVMMINHGLPKLLSFNESAAKFLDPLGVGASLSFALVVFAEFFCSLAIILGLLTRFAAIPLIITMAVAFFIIHAHDGWDKKEIAFLYLIAFLFISFVGAGKISIDNLIAKALAKKPD
jgi:putative oxidoreductase